MWARGGGPTPRERREDFFLPAAAAVIAVERFAPSPSPEADPPPAAQLDRELLLPPWRRTKPPVVVAAAAGVAVADKAAVTSSKRKKKQKKQQKEEETKAKTKKKQQPPRQKEQRGRKRTKRNGDASHSSSSSSGSSSRSSFSSSRSSSSSSRGSGVRSVTIKCPHSLVGRLIGRQGETVNDLQRRSGATIQIDQSFPVGYPREVTISGSADCVHNGRELVCSLIGLFSGEGANGRSRSQSSSSSSSNDDRRRPRRREREEASPQKDPAKRIMEHRTSFIDLNKRIVSEASAGRILEVTMELEKAKTELNVVNACTVLQRFGRANRMVPRQCLVYLAHAIESRKSEQLGAMQVGGALFGLRACEDSAATDELLDVLKLKIETTDDDLSSQALGNSLVGLCCGPKPKMSRSVDRVFEALALNVRKALEKPKKNADHFLKSLDPAKLGTGYYALKGRASSSAGSSDSARCLVEAVELHRRRKHNNHRRLPSDGEEAGDEDEVAAASPKRAAASPASPKRAAASPASSPKRAAPRSSVADRVAEDKRAFAANPWSTLSKVRSATNYDEDQRRIVDGAEDRWLLEQA